MGALDERIKNARVYFGKAIEKSLVLVFEEEEDVMDGIEKAMLENLVFEGELLSIEGTFKECVVSVLQKSNVRFKTLTLPKIKAISGKVRIKKEDKTLFGVIRIGIKEGNSITSAVLHKAKAKEGLKIKIKFYEIIEE